MWVVSILAAVTNTAGALSLLLVGTRGLAGTAWVGQPTKVDAPLSAFATATPLAA